jgi:hypothetical protein
MIHFFDDFPLSMPDRTTIYSFLFFSYPIFANPIFIAIQSEIPFLNKKPLSAPDPGDRFKLQQT